jgi:hypothetical protein
MYEPSSVVYHKISASIGTLSPVQTFHSARSRTIFVKRHLTRAALRRSVWLSAKSYGLRHLARGRWSVGIAGLRGLASGLSYRTKRLPPAPQRGARMGPGIEAGELSQRAG